MSKKLGIVLFVICMILCGTIYQLRMKSDRQGPELNYGNEGFIYHDEMTDDDLLADVKAIDTKDGDVSSTLAVESVFRLSDEEVVITYVAKDNSNNITKDKRTVKAEPSMNPEKSDKEDSEISPVPTNTPVPANTPSEDKTEEKDQQNSEEKEATADEKLPEEKEENLNSVSEVAETENTAEADTEEKEGLNSEETEEIHSEISYEQENEEARVIQEAAAESMPNGCPRIYLNEYVAHVAVGETIDLAGYVKEITDDVDDVYALWRKIQVANNPDTSVAGTYETTFYVIDSVGNTSNQAVLKFIVE